MDAKQKRHAGRESLDVGVFGGSYRHRAGGTFVQIEGTVQDVPSLPHASGFLNGVTNPIIP